MTVTRSRFRLSRLLLWLGLICLLLALWQWQQGIQASAQLAAHARAANLPPQALAEVEQGAHPQGQRVWLTVRESGHSVRVANASLQGRDGVREWQPVQLLDGSWPVLPQLDPALHRQRAGWLLAVAAGCLLLARLMRRRSA